MAGQLDVSYNRFCLVCGFARLHRNNISEYCTQCKMDKGDAECERIVKTKEGQSRSFYDQDRGLIIRTITPNLEVKKAEGIRMISGEGLSNEIVQQFIDPSPQKAERYSNDEIRKMTEESERAGNIVVPEGFITQPFSSESEEVVLYADGKIASSKCPHFHLIPTISLLRLCERFELGQKKKGDKAWNACSPNQEVLLDREWIIERLSHVIDHALKLRDKVSRGDIEGIKEDDDAGAIAWAGCFLIAATDAMMSKEKGEAERILEGWENEIALRNNPSPQKADEFFG